MHETAHLPVGSSLTQRGTPLHVAELVLLLLRSTFAELPADDPHRYSSRFEDTRIAFDVALNKESAIYGKKPLVVVSRGSTSTQPAALGDTASLSLPTLHAHKTMLIHSSVNVRVLSRAKAECEAVSQRVFDFLMQYRMLLPKYLGIHQAEAIQMSEVQKFEQDDEMFLTLLTFSFLQQPTWTQEAVAPVLRAASIVLGVKPA